MPAYNLTYKFTRKINVYRLDIDYQNNLTENQLRKVFGMYDVSGVELLEVTDAEEPSPGEQ